MTLTLSVIEARHGEFRFDNVLNQEELWVKRKQTYDVNYSNQENTLSMHTSHTLAILYGKFVVNLLTRSYP